MIKYIRKNIIKIIGFLIIIISLILLVVDKIKEKNIETLEIDSINSYFDNTQDESDLKEAEIIEPEDEIEYIAILEIPKINLEKGLSYFKNNINYNVQIIDGSNFPDQENSNLILAAHSGNSRVSFFKDLYKLNLKDKVYLYYNNNKYEFIIEDIYNVNKDGTVEIKRYRDKKTITLITCTKNSSTLQTVYIAYLNEIYPY